jgi:hypothetical protein
MNDVEEGGFLHSASSILHPGAVFQQPASTTLSDP